MTLPTKRLSPYFKSYHFGIETEWESESEEEDICFKSYHFGIETDAATSKPLIGRPPLNRTILELKQDFEHDGRYRYHSLNRTILELKLQLISQDRKGSANFKSYHFGIETELVFHLLSLIGPFKSYHFGIETREESHNKNKKMNL